MSLEMVSRSYALVFQILMILNINCLLVIFNCPSLTYLQLSNCVFKPSTCFLGFQNVVFLSLESLTFVPTSEYCVIKTPLLAKLILSNCAGMQYLNIVSPGLEYLRLRDCPYYYLVLNCFMNCKNLSCLELTFDKEVYNSSHDESSIVEKLLISLPALDVLHLSSFFVERLSKGVVPNGLPLMLNCLRYLSLVVDFGKLDQTSYVLHLIKSIPNLSDLHICVGQNTGDDDGAVLKYLDAPDRLEQPLNKLKLVTIDCCDGSESELLFVKLLLSYSPSLLRMCIELYKTIGIKGERDFLMELICFPRASPRAKLVYLPFSD